jgi:hypothetical protein
MPVPFHPYNVVSYVYVVLILNRGTYGIEIVQGHITWWLAVCWNDHLEVDGGIGEL